MVVAVLITMDRTGITPGIKTVSVILMVLLLSGITHVITGQAVEGGFTETVRTLYRSGSELTGGGAVAVLFGVYPLRWLGHTGALIVDILLFFVFFMISTGTTLIGLFRGAAKPVKKLEEAYTAAVENRQAAAEAAEAVQKNNRKKFNIDVALEGEEKTPAAARRETLSKEGEASRRKVERLTDAMKVSTNTGRAYDFESEPDQPVTPVPEPGPAPAAAPAVPPAAPPEASIEDLITRAVSGSAVVGEPPTEAGDGLLHFGETAEQKAAQEVLMEPAPEEKVYTFPPVNLLEEPKAGRGGNTQRELRANADRLVDTLRSFGVETRIVDISRGPAVTRYELQPSAGVKISRITNLADDIALNLAAGGVRIEAPIPNKAAIGIEVPNKDIAAVPIREIIDSQEFVNAKSRLSVALGKDITGRICLADLAKMPHLLIAGATGSGKSVCINSIIISLLYKASPEEVKLLMIDPKVVELGGYNGIPHLLVPVVTDPKKAAGALCWAVGEMLNRYKMFAATGTRDLEGYNRLAAAREELRPMPQIVIIIDELADLMMAAPKDVEDYICRLAQMARAAGMHLVIATQRPSVDVITGLIKANIPSRISFAVSSQIDSRTILDMGGAEKLLGRGDMLYYPVGSSKPTRVQGCFVTDSEVERVVTFIKQGEKGEYDDTIMSEIEQSAAQVKGKGGGASSAAAAEGDGDGGDELLEQAIAVVVEAGLASTSLLQRRLKVGYARAARLVD
ncbi:MAG: DNA translocase FtsK, partial [Angelakisella sp.]|nr:DNA translocase FtsK [Angelakisella sp.]